jgi:uracil-DNA glycosylase family 4
MRLAQFNEDVAGCTSCIATGLIFSDERGCARPLTTKSPSGALGVLVVGEAPNVDDTFSAAKRYLTYDSDTDPTGRFMRSLLIDEAGIRPAEIDDIVFTNAALCLPKRQRGKFPVVASQMANCTPWLSRLVDEAEPTIVVTMGAVALRAVSLVARHHLKLKSAAGRVHDWNGRKLLPLYHASVLGRINRPDSDQRRDMRALRTHLGR